MIAVETLDARHAALVAQAARGEAQPLGHALDGEPRLFVYDGVLPDPEAYRRWALSLPYTSLTVGAATFHGMASCDDTALADLIQQAHPRTVPGVTLFRRSPAGQVEPSFIHTDRDMGDWTGILYLTPDPPEADGTVFYRHRGTGAYGSQAEDAASVRQEWQDWRDETQWAPWTRVAARFNRLVLFPAPLFHARAIPENYGTGDDARLIQLVFGTGPLEEAPL